MLRPFRARGAVVTLLLAAGCQDYNFNPVGHCLIQPASRRVTLSNLSSADVLFVVDDSGSMAGEQQELAENFTSFIGNLDRFNTDRRIAKLEPFDFHIAVTSTSVFFNFETNGRAGGPYTCRADCPGAAGQPVCCRTDTPPAPARRAKACTTEADCDGPGVPANVTCGTSCEGLRGESFCCVQGATGAAAFPAGTPSDVIPCSRVGTECGTFETHYDFAGCGGTNTGVAADEWPYPQGDFVSWSSGATVNPRVLHFDKELYPETPNPAATNRQGFTSAQLQQFFSGGAGRGGNVIVGTCGSGEEQALAAAQAAIEKARDGRQRDTYPRTSATPTWDPGSRTAGSPAEWFAPGANSKLVVVFVGDEDDCSPAVADPSAAVVWKIADLGAGQDSCALDGDPTRPPPLGRKQRSVQSFVDFFTGLGRPVAAGFILPAREGTCSLATCTAGATAADRCCPPGGCTSTEGAQGRGVRLLATAEALAARGVEVVAGSICDPNFGTILDDIANIVKPPSGLELPDVPAAREVTLLRIAFPDGRTRKLCSDPAPAGLSLADAGSAINPETRQAYDWWFTAEEGPGGSVSVSRFVYINPLGSCTANPGETYSADFLARLPPSTPASPAGGCWDDPAYELRRTGGETRGDAMCRTILGGTEGSWTCFKPGATAQTCGTNIPDVNAPGTCICGGRSDNCSG